MQTVLKLISEIKCGSDISLLGLTIDQNLDFGKHVSEVCKRAGRKVAVLTRLRKILSTRAKLITNNCHTASAKVLPYISLLGLVFMHDPTSCIAFIIIVLK